ncbi:hypothetical protein [Microbacterium sufflavum]|uniref:Uncharacterized protein n=1 Tax=Microbacterium sufflavum TaxID=2851649 RepID=A0ABY4ID35_9MICO|nr:hypothetical protein [Microbacterium sufflavum]UPL10650.1 hypothetical protein KV394_05830 [Microbacterium sufflavum]
MASSANNDSISDLLSSIDQRVAPDDVTLTDKGVAKEYGFGQGSVLTVFERPHASGGSIDGRAAAVSVGSDYNGQYIQFSPADQRSFLSGWGGFMLGSLGLLMGPLGAVILGSIGSAIAPQIEQLTCAARNKSIRFTYTVDGNVTNARCV